MSKIKLDLSSFKHLKTDKDSTTLQHKGGHQLTLAHHSLSPEAQVQLKSLAGLATQDQTPDQSTEAREQKMAKGGNLTSHLSPDAGSGRAMYAIGSNVKIPPGQGGQTTASASGSGSFDKMSPAERKAAAASSSQQNETENNSTWDKIKEGASNAVHSAEKALGYAAGGEVCHACGGKIGHYDEGGKAPIPNQQSNSQAPVSKSEHNIPSNVNTPSSVSDAMSRLSNAWAKGGEVNPKLEQSRVEPRQPELERPHQETPTLNYPQLKKEYHDKNKTNFIPGEKRKMYDDGGAVSNDQIPIGIRAPSQDPSEGLVPNYNPSKEPISVSNVEPKDAVHIGYLAGKYGGDFLKTIGGAAIKGVSNVADAGDQVMTGLGAGVMGNKEPVGNEPVTPADLQHAQQESAQVGEAAPIAPPQPPQAPTAPTPVQQSTGMPDTVGAMMNNYAAGVKNYNAALGQKAHAESGQALGTVQALQDNQKILNDAYGKYEQRYGDLVNEYQNHQKDIENGYIDPDAYWKDHSKLSSGIGMILAGFNPTNKPNAAIDFLNQQINRNIDAQKANLGAKNNLLQANLQQFHNLHDATDMTRLMLQQGAQMRLDKAAAQAGSPMAFAKANEAKSLMQMEASKVLGEMAFRHTIMQGLNETASTTPGDTRKQESLANSMEMMGMPEQAKALKSRIIPGIGVSTSQTIPDSVRSGVTAYHNVNDLYNRALQIASQPTPTNPAEFAKYRASAETVHQNMIAAIKQAQHDGVYKESEAQFLLKQIGDSPASFLANFKAVPKIQEMQRIGQDQYKNMLSTYGIAAKPLPGQEVQQTQQPQYKTVNGVKYMRGPNGQAIPVR